MNDIKYKRIHFINFFSILKISSILRKCGKDMAIKYGIHHWDNSLIKNLLIVMYGLLRNETYLITHKKEVVGTVQIYYKEDYIHFSKLAVLPDYNGRGYGSIILSFIFEKGVSMNKTKVLCEVYDKSEHAISFYLNRGFVVVSKTKTLKYTELVMEKGLK